MTWTFGAVNGVLEALVGAPARRALRNARAQQRCAKIYPFRRPTTARKPSTMAFVLAGGRCTTLAEAAKLMWRNRCRSLLVLNDAGEVISVVTERDLLQAAGRPDQNICELTVSEIISTPRVQGRSAAVVA